MKLNLVRRLERLEAELSPGDDKPALTIFLTSVGQTDQIIEVRGRKPGKIGLVDTRNVGERVLVEALRRRMPSL